MTSSYHLLGDVLGQGTVLNSLVGPASAGQQMFYLSYIYINGTLDLVAVNPNTGKVSAFPSPVSSEEGAWGLATGPDQNLYIGTLPDAHLLKFDTGLSRLSDLGQVPADPATATTQTYIWQMTVSPHNHNVYACTYPSADLVSYNPLASAPRMINLGTMDRTGHEEYIRSCVADPDPNSPYIYVGMGSVNSEIAAYNTDTNTVAFQLVGSNAGFGWAYLGADQHVYAMISNGALDQYYVLSDGSYTLISTSAPPQVAPAPTNLLKDGSTIAVSPTTTTISHPDGSTQTFPYTYTGRNLSIFRLGAGPNGKIYGGTAMPYDFFSFDTSHPTSGTSTLGQLGDGEPYSFAAFNGLLNIAAYSSQPLEIFNPTQPFNAAANPFNAATSTVQTDLRPQAMISAPNGNLYIGAIASYGKLTGPLIAWNTGNRADQQEFYPEQNQGVTSLTLSRGKCQGSGGSFCVIGGTSIYGGSGTTPTTSAAQLFTWDTTTNTIVRQYTIPNVRNPSMITDLVTDQASGYVYGIAISSAGDYVFAFNPATGTFVNGVKLLPFGFPGSVYNSATIYNGKFWGVAPQGIFSVNLGAGSIGQATLFQSSSTITAGFAVSGNALYFGSNSDLWSYTMS